MIFSIKFISPGGIKFYPHIVSICNDKWIDVESSCLRTYGLKKYDIFQKPTGLACPFVFTGKNLTTIAKITDVIAFSGFDIYDIAKGEFFYLNNKLILDMICDNKFGDKEICRGSQI